MPEAMIADQSYGLGRSGGADAAIRAFSATRTERVVRRRLDTTRVHPVHGPSGEAVDIGNDMKCWICGQEANTGEHLIKASDLREIFGTGVTQKAPLYFNNSARKNVAIGGFKSRTLKYQTRICGDCNHARTQRYDTAWADLSAFLRSRQPPVRKGSRIDLTRIFPNSVDRAMLDVHLFFVKQFGCQIVEHGIPIATAPFADAILKGVAHPYVRLVFTEGVTYRGRPRAAVTPVKAVLLGQRAVFATWSYMLDRISVNVVYVEPNEHPRSIAQSWHPYAIGTTVDIG